MTLEENKARLAEVESKYGKKRLLPPWAKVGIVLMLVCLIVMFVWSDYTYYIECKELCELYGQRCEVVATRYSDISSYSLW
jgi:hypothetical protein